MAPEYAAVEGFPESKSFRESEVLHRDWASCRRGGRFIYERMITGGQVGKGRWPGSRIFRNRKLRWGDGKKIGVGPEYPDEE